MNQSFFYSKEIYEKKKYPKNPCNDDKINNCWRIVQCLGATGPTGARGVLNYADFYALMPPDNAVALTITPLAGGTQSVSAHLVILQIA